MHGRVSGRIQACVEGAARAGPAVYGRCRRCTNAADGATTDLLEGSNFVAPPRDVCSCAWGTIGKSARTVARG